MYNFLRDARTIRNSYLCVHDALDGYSSDFHVNGNVDGWDIYSSVYLYGCWNGTLFGSSYDRSCYIGRSTSFVPLPAETFYYIRIMMKITNNNPDKVAGGLTTGRIRWTTLADNVWNSTKQMDFDIVADDEWHLYNINMGPAQWWQGDINNLRIYPFIDGWPKDQFTIRFIKISSVDTYKCANTQCDYYVNYSHPCPGAGQRGSCEAGIAAQTYTVVSGVNDDLVVNIDGYGDVTFYLGTCSGANGPDMSRVVAEKIGSLYIGGYAYAECEYTEFDKLKIISGVVGANSSVTVSGAAAEALGFFQSGADVSTKTTGSAPASGFDYASSRILTATEINRLLNGYTNDMAYIHEPLQYNLEAGRRDYNEVGTGRLFSDVDGNNYYESIDNTGRTLIDISHPFNANGRVKHLYLYGRLYGTSKIKILRPHLDGTFSVVYSFDLPTQSASYIYTSAPIAYRVDCDALVNKGDLLGIYNADVYVGVSISGLPDAAFFQVTGDVSGDFDPGNPKAFGVAGFSVYARGDRYQSNIKLDIDFGDRVNIEQANIHGKEEVGYFEFNIASCLDLTWNVNLYNESHDHSGVRWTDGTPWNETHLNKYYGKECLDDGIRTADNGQVGTSYGRDATGIWTAGSNHSYFYVNGDAEWLYSDTCTGKTEFCWPYVPGSAWGPAGSIAIGGFTEDPIAFTLIFPYDYSLPVHKSIIYFKERNNFRHMSLSYYLGPYNTFGNSDDPNFQYVPSYTSIKLDGVPYLPTDDVAQIPYLFSNPMDDTLIYAAGDHDPINWENFAAADISDWNVIEHNFDAIMCKGFRIFTHKHFSTKITEMEVYSKVTTTPSMVDNVLMTFSTDGNVWNTALFNVIDDHQISAFIGGAPRYFSLDIDSATRFVLNEIEFLVGDQVKLEGCNDLILPEHAKSGEVSLSTPVVLENVYGRDLDLTVDLPREKSEIGNVLFWSKLHSQEDVDKPALGPPCRLYKESDIEVGHKNYQCAINCFSYGLKNLIHDKQAYYNYYEDDWLDFGTLISGTSIDYCNTSRINVKKSEFTFTPSSSVYWKIVPEQMLSNGYIKDIIAYYNDERVDIDEVYLGSTPGIYAQTSGVVSDGIGIPLGSRRFVYDDFEDGSLNPMWTTGMIQCTGATIVETGGRVGPGSYGTWVGSGDAYHGPYIQVNSGLDISDFTLDFTYRWGYGLGYIMVSFYDASMTLKSYFYVADWWTGDTRALLYFIDNGVTKINGTGLESYTVWAGSNTMSFKRSYTNTQFIYNGVSIWSGTTNYAAMRYVRVSFLKHASYGAVSPLDVETFNLHGLSLSNNVGFGFKLHGSDPVNKIKIFHEPVPLAKLTVYTSPNNADNYVRIDDNFTGGLAVTTNNVNYYSYFAIDLEQRHDLAIIRNYGNATNKMALSITDYMDYSNTTISDPYSVDWANSTYDDARWARVKLLCGDGATRCIRKLGIYPDISNAYCHGGGYNCEWEPLGTILTEYTPSINVAYGSTTTGTNYYFMYGYPEKAVDGIHTKYDWDECWAFQTISGVNAYLELDFEATYTINKVILYHGYNPSDSTYLNTAYTISVSPTTSGSFTTVFTKSGNTEFTTTHQFTPVEARRLRLTVTGYNSSRSLVIDPLTGLYYEFYGSFLRDIEVYTYTDEGYVDSETWPIVCVDLKDQFNITGHDLVNKDITDTVTNWDNSEEFFNYSDSLYDDPKKVFFSSGGEIVVVYSKTQDSGNIDKRGGTVEYVFDTGIYFEKGIYNIEWDARNPSTANLISLRLEGLYTIDDYADSLGTGVVHQIGVIEVPEDGFYDVKGILHEEYAGTDASYWGVRNPAIYRSAGLRKWAAVERNIATNYGTGSSGIDYLSQIKVYGNTEYKPFEYSWWVTSSISALSNNAINTVVGRRSLEISYPASSGTDVVYLREGDSLSDDIYFDSKHFLCFWWYIDNVSNLNTSFGNIKFGTVNEADPIYYRWDISSLSLVSGWNKIRLKFEDADYFYPEADFISSNPAIIDSRLDFRHNGREFKSFMLTYAGIGNILTMNLDDLRIERNVFDEDVKFGKGLFLNGYEFLDVPLSSISLEKGSIEFWMKSFVTYYGADIFDNVNSRVLFTIVNNNNNIISLGIRSTGWFMPLMGHIRKDLKKFNIALGDLPPSAYLNRGDVVHVGIVWSNDGSFTDNGDTVRLYINNELIVASKTTWELDDTKAAMVKFGGPNTQLAYNYDIWGGGIFENIKIYDYCKNSFNLDYEGITKELVYSPNEFLEISQDDVNFYGLGSPQIPFIFERVPAGDSKTIYIRTNKTEGFKQSALTATLIVEWLSSV